MPLEPGRSIKGMMDTLNCGGEYVTGAEFTAVLGLD